MPVLVKFQDNYADEFDCEGFFMYADNEEFGTDLYNLVRLSNAYFAEHFGNDEVEFYFGTNEFLVFDCAEELLNCYTSEAISEEEYNCMVKLFPELSKGPDRNYGTCITIKEAAEYFRTRVDA